MEYGEDEVSGSEQLTMQTVQFKEVVEKKKSTKKPEAAPTQSGPYRNIEESKKHQGEEKVDN